MKTIEQINNEISLLQEELKEVKGTETEVYTRIVGYHRAVDNWNRGKKEEFGHRLTFKFDDMKLEERNLLDFSRREKKDEPVHEEKKEKVSSSKFKNSDIAHYKLFTSQFCRNCPPVKDFIKGIDIAGEELDVSTDLGISASRQYNVLSTPTVIFFDKKSNIINTAYSTEDLKRIFKKKEALV